MVNLDFANRTIHLGYYLLGSLFIRSLPLPTDYALNLMNCFFGALSVLLIYLIAFTILKNQLVAFVSSVLLLTNYLFVFNAVYAEVYMPQLFFLPLTIQLVLWKRASMAGLSFAISFLITPSAIFGLPYLIILRPDKQAIFRFSRTALIVVTIALIPHFDNYLLGGRGLLKEMQSGMHIDHAILKEGKELLDSMFLYLPFVLAGIMRVIAQKRLYTLGIAIISLWLVSFVFGERFSDVPV